jgi:hypothetical protein
VVFEEIAERGEWSGREGVEVVDEGDGGLGEGERA